MSDLLARINAVLFLLTMLLYGLHEKEVLAQSTENVPLQFSISERYEHAFESASSFHSLIKPYMGNQVLDTSTSALLNTSWSIQKGGFSAKAIPLAHTRAGWADEYLYEGALGAGVSLQFGEKLTLAGAYWRGAAKLPPYLQEFVDENHVVPGVGIASGDSGISAVDQLSGYVSYSPSAYFNFQLGQGKHFWGDGYRSLWLSDYAANYPYLKVATTVWKIKYVNLFSLQKDIQSFDATPDNPRYKFAAFHVLSWNVSKRVNLSFFESIIWQARDTLADRWVELNYFNPVIFYRPVEFAQGSADNALLGFGIKFKATALLTAYGQALLDEFLLKEVRAGNGWWANKYGFQLGLKYRQMLKIDGLSGRTEFNLVRPFTYTHGSALQNFGHLNQPLAHPLGNNFYEWVQFFNYEWDRYILGWQFNYAIFGRNPEGEDFGADIYVPNFNPSKEFGNYIGQGERNRLIYNRLSAAYLLDPSTNLKITLSHEFRALQTGDKQNSIHYLSLTLSTELANFYRDF